jgi:hypothetical protein
MRQMFVARRSCRVDAGLPAKHECTQHRRLLDIPAWRDPFTGLDAPELPPIRKRAG